MDPKQLRTIIKEEVTDIVQNQVTKIVQAELKPIKKDLEGLGKDVASLKGEVKEMSENVNAARGDIEHIHMDIKGIRDKESLFHSRNKREIDEIKTHLNMPLISDVPEV